MPLKEKQHWKKDHCWKSLLRVKSVQLIKPQKMFAKIAKGAGEVYFIQIQVSPTTNKCLLELVTYGIIS